MSLNLEFGWRRDINRAREHAFFIAQHRVTISQAGDMLRPGVPRHRPPHIDYCRQRLAERERGLWEALGRIARAEAAMAAAGIPFVSFFQDEQHLLGRAA